MLRRGFRLARILGIQVSIDYSWFFIFFLVLWSLAQGYFPARQPGQPNLHFWLAGLTGTVLFFGSVLAHELSHSLVARALGVKVLGITLFLFGGVSTLASDPGDAWTEIKVAAAGPLMSFLLGGIFAGLAILAAFLDGWSPLIPEVLGYLGFINVVLGAFNLVPGFPLDGGRVLRAVWWLRTGSANRATRLAARSGKAIASLLMLLGGVQLLLGGPVQGLWMFLIGLFLRAAALAAYRDLELRQSLEGTYVADVLEPLPPAIPRGTTVEDAAREYFLRHGASSFPVVWGEMVLGILPLRALKGVPPPARASVRVEEVMVRLADVPAVGPEIPLQAALVRMAESGQENLLVVDQGRPVGRITREGVGRLLRTRRALASDAGNG